MANREDMCAWVEVAVKRLGGSASIVEVAEELWSTHEDELRESGRLLFTWQYDMRWCALVLRKRGFLRPANQSPRGVWEAVTE